MPLDRRALAKWLPILIGACGGARHPIPASPSGVHRDAGPDAAVSATSPPPPTHKVYCWLVADPRCPHPVAPPANQPWRGC